MSCPQLVSTGSSKDRKSKLAPKDDKGFLDYLALLGRPRAAAVVGLKESALGSDIYKALGGVDLTPEEGLLEVRRRVYRFHSARFCDAGN